MRPAEAVVLAAGASRRFGPSNKLLAPWGTGTVCGTVVEVLAGCGLTVHLVVGHDSERVAAACPLARAVFNPRYDAGMGTSLAVGVRACTPGAPIVVALGDMPGLSPDAVRELLRHLDGRPGRVVVPVYAGAPDRIGHPVLFGPGHRGALTALTGDAGARGVVASARDVVRVAISGELRDIDLADDLRTL